ncbi:MAG: hypothetical protein LRY73_17995 [Bacillus sp. (in: Bacteria)]|nr:hypothetical protein [Bacillus sp. (in: firmicutes)]
MGNAIHYYEKALEIGEHTFPYYRLGEVAFSQNQLEEAKEWYKKMSLLDPTMTAPLLKLAEMASMKEETRLEQDYLFQVMKRCPFDVNMIHFAQLSFEEGKLPEVVDYLKKNEATLDGVWRFYALAQCEGALGNIESEEAYLIQGLKLDPDDFNLQESYAVLKLKQGDYEEACSLLKNLIMIDLEYRPLYALLSEALLESGMIKNTSKFLQAIDLSNEEKSFVFMYTANELEQCLWDMVSEGVVEKKLLKLLKKTVVELYETSLRFNKENDTAFIWLMEYYNTRNGDLDYSIKMCSKRLKNSWSFDLGFYLSQLIINNYVEQHHRKKETEYARAEVILFQCLEEDPDHPGVHYALGRLYNELNAIEEGEASLLRAMVLDPSDHDIYYETSRLFEKKGDFKRGEEMVRKCIELQPEFLLAYNQLSILLHQQGKTLDAMEVIDELIGMDEGNALAHYNKACYLSALKKDPFVALEHLTLAINNDEGHYLKELGKTDLDLRHLFENHATSSKMKQLFR